MDFEFKIEYLIRKKRSKHFREVSPKNPFPSPIIRRVRDFRHRIIEARRFLKIYNMDRQYLPARELTIEARDIRWEDEDSGRFDGCSLYMNLTEDSFFLVYLYSDKEGNLHKSIWTEKAAE